MALGVDCLKSTLLKLLFTVFSSSAKQTEFQYILTLEKLHSLPLGELANISPRQTQATSLGFHTPTPAEST